MCPHPEQVVLEISLEKLSAQWNDLSAQKLKYVTNAGKVISPGHLLSALGWWSDRYFEHWTLSCDGVNKPWHKILILQPDDLVNTLGSQEFYTLKVEEQLRLLSGLCQRIMGSYSVQDYMTEKQREYSELWWAKQGWIRDHLTHWGRDKMAAIYQTTFSNAFSWMKMYKFRLRFHWSLFQRVQFTIFQHWFK